MTPHPPFPSIMDTPITREEIIEALWLNYKEMIRLLRKYEDSTIRRYPDLELVLQYIEEHGLPPK